MRGVYPFLFYPLKILSMKKLHLFMLPVVCLCSTIATGQTILNGSLEPGGAVTTCADAPKASFNNFMGNVWDASELPNIYQGTATCGIGAPADGNGFTVLKYRLFPGNLGNLLTFKLNGPLSIGQQYKIAIQYRTIAGTPPTGGLRYGYCKDSASFDSSCGTRGQIQNTNWVADTLVFTPTQAWKYIFIEALSLQGNNFDLHIDNLVLLKSTNGVVETSAPAEVNIYPNPAHGDVNVSLGEGIQLPCKMQLTDLTGRILQQQTITDRTTTMKTEGLAAGMYIVHLTGKDEKTYTTRLIAE
jgi:hypothetical protein